MKKGHGPLWPGFSSTTGAQNSSKRERERGGREGLIHFNIETADDKDFQLTHENEMFAP